MGHAGIAAPQLTSMEDARRIVLEHAVPYGTEQLTLSSSVGRVVARDLVAETALPPFDNSAMDGYAIRSVDTGGASTERPVTLRLIGEVPAGSILERGIGRGEAVKIMTGAPLPPGADSVVALEEARLRGERVEILGEVSPERHVRKAGEDIKTGEIALASGTRIRVQHLGLLAGLGYAEVPVARQPSVAILATGSELIGIDEPLGAGKIRNSNSLVLAALVRQVGIEPVDLGVVIDARELIRQRLEDAARYDIVLISGGVSVGEHDLVKQVLRALGMETLFWRVNMKPGKPLLFGRWQHRLVFGLPGNPISCVVGFLAFIAPCLWKTMGAHDLNHHLVQARVAQPIRKKEPKTQLFTAHLREESGVLMVTPTPQQGSGMLTSLAQANAFIVVSAERMELEEGSLVEVLPLGDGPWRS